MRVGFALYRYFPHGGLQRDFRAMADECARRGHETIVWTTRWEAPQPSNLTVKMLRRRGWTNHTRYEAFARDARACWEAESFDAVVGFHKMPGLDLYFAGDPCYRGKVEQRRGLLTRLTPRYRVYMALEQGVFDPVSRTRILILSEPQQQDYMRWWGTPANRFELLPPGISRDRQAPPDAAAVRQAFRTEWEVRPEDTVVLMVGSAFKTKGLDRALKALAALPDTKRRQTWLFVVGRGQAGPFQRLAAKLGVKDRLRLVGGRDDVTRFLVGADLLLHPAYTETYGMVLLEALAAGLPVLTTANCGYAYHIQRADAGRVVPVPFEQSTLNQALKQTLDQLPNSPWHANALDYIARTDVFSLPERAADIIESVAQENRSHGV